MSAKLEIAKGFSNAGQERIIFDNLTLEITPGEILSIVGPSGCGKTTLMRILAGLDSSYQGIYQNSFSKPVLIFQESLLFSWLNVYRNLEMVVLQNFSSKISKQKFILGILKKVGLASYRKYPVWKLSGGMKKRVEIARAMAANADLFLFDEALANLDYLSRMALLEQIKIFLKKANRTAVYVTHDIREALLIADRVAIFSMDEKHIGNIHRLADFQDLWELEKRIYEEIRKTSLSIKHLEHPVPPVQ